MEIEIINLMIAEVQEAVRNEGGIPALIRMVQSSDIRVQRMALKAINNILTECTAETQETFLENGATVILLKMLLTTSLEEESALVEYIINIFSSLLLCDRGVEEICSRGIAPLIRTYTLCKQSLPELSNMILYLFRLIGHSMSNNTASSVGSLTGTLIPR